MNILQIVSRLDKSDRADDVVKATRFLTLNGHKSVVISPGSPRVREIDEVGARHYRVPLNTNIFLLPFLVFRITQIAASENIQVIHARDPISSFAAFLALGFLNRLAAKPALEKIVLITAIYGSFNKKGFLYRSQFWAKRVICLSRAEAQDLMESRNLSPQKIRVIPPCIVEKDIASDRLPRTGSLLPAADAGRRQAGDTHALRDADGKTLPREGNDFYIYVALPLSSPQAAQNFIKIISLLTRNISRLKVLAIDCSPFSERESMEKFKILVKRHSLSGTISVTPGPDIQFSDRKPDVFVQIEGDSGASLRRILLMQANGVAVVTTDKGYATDDKTSVLCCKDSNPQAIAGGIQTLYKDKKLRERITEEARNFVTERFSVKKVMNATIGLYEEALSTSGILIIKIGALGDVILVTPSVRAIRDRFPKAKITLLTGIRNREVFANSPLIDEIVVCDFAERDRGLEGLWRIACRLRSMNFDLVIDFQNNRKSHSLSFLSFAPTRVGYDNGKFSFLLNKKIKDEKPPINPVEHQSRLLGLLGIKNVNEKLELWPSEKDDEWAESFLNSHWAGSGKNGKQKRSKTVALNIGSSPKWITKLWPVEYYADISNRLARDFGVRVILIGDERNATRVEEYLKLAKCKPILAVGKTNIPRLASLIKKCSLLISSDSAPIHVAASVDTPFLAFFGPTSPDRHLPPSAKCKVFIKKELACSPCYHSYCNKGYKCMLSIKPDDVYESVLELLNLKGLPYQPDFDRYGETGLKR
ncbi:MAG: glycosyltransferase [Candidatus Omnitrophica bacterium]|nr:glycosyltransferase [Candidatus Omnitrophota bacterium]